MPANSTVDLKGTKSVLIMTTGHGKDHFTVMLACLGDGTQLPPMWCLSEILCQKIWRAAMGYPCSRSSQRVDRLITCERLAELHLI